MEQTLGQRIKPPSKRSPQIWNPAFWEVSRQGDLDSIKTMTENGMTLVPLSDELKAQIAERAGTVQAAFFERVPDAIAIVDAYRASK